MEINEPYPIDVIQRINDFLDRIERVLLDRDTPRAERISICAEVESQIHTMMERKMEAGAELNLELVCGIIESMDPPESYASTAESQTIKEGDSNASVTPATTNIPLYGFASWIKDRFQRTTPGIDWVAVSGLASTCFGSLLILAGARGGRGGEAVAVFGFLMIFAGVAASGISFWRIRHSNGLLTGQKVASIGMLILPLLILNGILSVILFASPIGRFLGAITLVTGLVYANYRFVQYALRWLASYSAVVPLAEPTKPEPSTVLERCLEL